MSDVVTDSVTRLTSAGL